MHSFYLSFTKYDFVYDKAPTVVGLETYAAVLQDKSFHVAFENTMHFAMWFFPLLVIFSLGIALLLNQRFVGNTIVRTAVFWPVIVSLALTGVLFQGMILGGRFGFLNHVLANVLGLSGLTRDWLVDPKTAMPVLVAVSLWKYIGFEALIFLAGLQAVPSALYDAAKVDGADAWRRFVHVTLPNIKESFAAGRHMGHYAIHKGFRAAFHHDARRSAQHHLHALLLYLAQCLQLLRHGQGVGGGLYHLHIDFDPRVRQYAAYEQRTTMRDNPLVSAGLRRLGDAGLYAAASIVTIIFVAPLLWVVLTSLKPNEEIYRVPLTILPQQVVFSQYEHVLIEMSEFTVYFINTVVVSSVSLILIVLLGSLAGYAFGCLSFRGSRVLLALVLVALTVPYAVYLIPVFIMENWLNLVDTKLGLILPYTALNLPLAIFIMRGTYRNIPKEIEDQAMIDGAGRLQSWFRVMTPIAMPGVATTAIFTFVSVWSEFMFARALMLSKGSYTLPIGITFLQSESQSWNFGVLGAAIVLTLLPILAVFLALQRFLVRGIMEGALKG